MMVLLQQCVITCNTQNILKITYPYLIYSNGLCNNIYGALKYQ